VNSSQPSKSFPSFFTVRQHFDRHPVEIEVAAAVERELGRIAPALARAVPPRASIAIALGSRGVTGMAAVTAALVAGLRGRGYEPFVVPAMGSHGGTTPEGQEKTLALLGITEASIGAPIRSQAGTLLVARTDSGLPVYADRLAAGADAVIPVNRVFTHTIFTGPVESGLLKMLAIGLGKEDSAATAHRAAITRGLGAMVLEVGRKVLSALNVPFGLAVVENGRREIARIRAVAAEVIEEEEADLLVEAKRLKPRIPFDFLHLLVVDRMGKNFSGTGIDTKVVGRMMQTGEPEPATPRYLRIYVGDLAPEAGGNAHGMGLADFISERLAAKIDMRVTLANAVTACAPQKARRPPEVASDREGIEMGLSTAGMADPAAARVVRIANTRDLERLWISEALLDEAKAAGLEIEEGPFELRFDAAGNLPAWGRGAGRP
jgi:hypothetical protein